MSLSVEQAAGRLISGGAAEFRAFPLQYGTACQRGLYLQGDHPLAPQALVHAKTVCPAKMPMWRGIVDGGMEARAACPALAAHGRDVVFYPAS